MLPTSGAKLLARVGDIVVGVAVSADLVCPESAALIRLSTLP